VRSEKHATVSDAGFDFKTPERREAKRFEPPPWEQEAFEDLRKQRGDDGAEQVEPTEPTAAEGEPEGPTAAAGLEPEPPGEEGRVAQPAAELDPKHVTEMLSRLSEEEPSIREATWKMELFTAFVGGMVGLMLFAWGFAAFAGAGRRGPLGALMAVLIVVAGAGFVAGSVWMIVRTLRQRGVL
jgi:hypothetical protein